MKVFILYIFVSLCAIFNVFCVQEEVTKYYKVDDKVVAYDTNGVLNYVHTDQLGSVVAVTDNTGNIVKNTSYKPFGETISDTVTTNRKFTGYIKDLTGLYYANARYYNPGIGKFISADPARDGFNVYAYCSNNPVMLTDPTGYSWIDALKNIKPSTYHWFEFGIPAAIGTTGMVSGAAALAIRYNSKDEETWKNNKSTVLGLELGMSLLVGLSGVINLGFRHLGKRPFFTELSKLPANTMKSKNLDFATDVVLLGGAAAAVTGTSFISAINDPNSDTTKYIAPTTIFALMGLAVLGKVATPYFIRKWNIIEDAAKIKPQEMATQTERDLTITHSRTELDVNNIIPNTNFSLITDPNQNMINMLSEIGITNENELAAFINEKRQNVSTPSNPKSRRGWF